MDRDIPEDTECPQCHGTGKRNGGICDLCGGSGRRVVTRYAPDTNPYEEND
jgi:DnaJ-class molecular chaperone